jgi:hypothetical protein
MMSKRNINLDHVKDLKLRDDGKEIQLTFVGKNDQSLTVTMSFEQVQALESKILQGAYAARLKPMEKSDTPKNFSAAPEVYLVNELQLEFHPQTGQISFVIGDREKRQAVVTLTEEHTRLLRQILSGKGDQFQMG